jgi:regulator of RNase E activity RraB
MNKCKLCQKKLTKESYIYGDKAICFYCFDKLREIKRDFDIIDAHKKGLIQSAEDVN